MKGYLQRLVRTVTNPAESVRPWTGSIFAAGHHGDFNIVPTEELAPVAAAWQSSQSPLPLPSTETSSPNDEHKPRISDLQPAQNFQDSTAAEPSPNLRPLVNERIIPEPLIPDATDLEITPVQEPETVVPPRGRRSFADGQAVIKPGNTRQLASRPPLAAGDKTEARASLDSVAADRQADEIQIHIGRIEVTAVHPPPPAKSKPRDNEISLDAYLKRSDGRTR